MNFLSSGQQFKLNLRETNRVCRYDRAGLGWSEVAEQESLSVERAVSDLQEALSSSK